MPSNPPMSATARSPLAAILAPAKNWIDLENTPHIPFFKPIIRELDQRGYTVVLTARDAFQVCELADKFGLPIVDIPPGRTADIRCVYQEQPDVLPHSESVSYRLGVAVRDDLSELRDSYGHLLRFRG
jgi:hypothetical protein